MNASDLLLGPGEFRGESRELFAQRLRMLDRRRPDSLTRVMWLMRQLMLTHGGLPVGLRLLPAGTCARAF